MTMQEGYIAVNPNCRIGHDILVSITVQWCTMAQMDLDWTSTHSSHTDYIPILTIIFLLAPPRQHYLLDMISLHS